MLHDLFLIIIYKKRESYYAVLRYDDKQNIERTRVDVATTETRLKLFWMYTKYFNVCFVNIAMLHRFISLIHYNAKVVTTL